MNNLNCFIAFVIIISTLYETCNANIYGYNVTVFTTSDKDKKFDSVTGKFKIDLKGKDSAGKNFSHYIVLNPDGDEIKFNRSYSYPAGASYPLENITDVNLRWTLKSPFNPIYLVNKPKVYFDRITIQGNQAERGISTQSVRIYCGSKRKAVGIKHDEAEVFVTCLPLPLYPIPGLTV
ncbi:uncharacterized protein LOC128395651 [Panonychus citri]|uniref:uncharacterized protein LOC128395651 n=1 Tax=Panonychus citri TaxID=50023 RepID=UPI002307F8A7|nr:uncharacterized protein LOC128395651 [Panonychus citri]